MFGVVFHAFISVLGLEGDEKWVALSSRSHIMKMVTLTAVVLDIMKESALQYCNDVRKIEK